LLENRAHGTDSLAQFKKLAEPVAHQETLQGIVADRLAEGARPGSRELTTADAARLLSISPATLYWWRLRGHEAGPNFVRFSQRGRVRYELQALRAFIRRRTVEIPKVFSERRARILQVLGAIGREHRLSGRDRMCSQTVFIGE
jgi:hypothetical protein